MSTRAALRVVIVMNSGAHDESSYLYRVKVCLFFEPTTESHIRDGLYDVGCMDYVVIRVITVPVERLC